MQVVWYVVFMVLGGLGVQEVIVVLFVQMFGVDCEMVLLFVVVKCGCEVLFGCFVFGLWQFVELVCMCCWLGGLLVGLCMVLLVNWVIEIWIEIEMMY